MSRRIALIAGLALLAPTAARAQGWPGHGRDAQHSALGSVASQRPQMIRWSTPVDLAPQLSGGELLTHYGSPLVTAANTVVLPVKTGATDGFRVDARHGGDGTLLWSQVTDYSLPVHNWIPPCGPTLTPGDKAVVIPAAGGTVLVRTFPDKVSHAGRVAFYGNANYAANPGACNAAIQICTPVTSDAAGNLYFGYISSGAEIPGYPGGLPSGLARISALGVGGFVAASSLANDAAMKKVAYNCAPALSTDGSSVYVAVNSTANGQSGFGSGYLCKLDATTLNPQAQILLKDPRSGNVGLVPDDGTATPTVGPDGNVYFGILENGLGSNHARGWLLQFDAGLTAPRTPGAFGWDDSASIVPKAAVPGYNGSSAYLLLTKYNNYIEGGGDGLNRVAVLDPNDTQLDPVSGTINVMKEVITVLGPTPNGEGGVREWCINTAAIDPINKCAIINCEDGHVYRWDFATNSLTAALNLGAPIAEAYTSTAIGPDGAIYATNNATLFCCVATPPGPSAFGGNPPSRPAPR